eukprot:TRINITY_DN11841_c0_g1_i1.p1 TRINITY_DN11841_c0_g1~~TRINITY_DN11841_c0_g1_i1.p1  ORF type:complete len:473 (+),score=77.72 TRINITY_DN11841_c0_g1_i1:254-1672(+)
MSTVPANKLVSAEDYGTVARSYESRQEATIDNVHARRAFTLACFVCAVAVGEGYDIGVMNGAIVRLKESFDCSTFEISLVVAVNPLFVIPGSLIGGSMADEYGRWRSLLVCCLTLIMGPLTMSLAPTMVVLIMARALVGVGIGMGYVIPNMYVVEISPSHLRGRFTMIFTVFMFFGIVGGYFMNYILLGIADDWRWMLRMGSVLPIPVVLAMLLQQVPESPRWLHQCGHIEEAEEILTCFVGCEEAERVSEALRKDQLEAHEFDEHFGDWGQVLGSCVDVQTRRMFFAAIVVACAQMAGGVTDVTFYSSTILQESMTAQSAFFATLSMGLVMLSATLLALVFLETLGRRQMLLASTFTCAASCVWITLSISNSGSSRVKAAGFCLFMLGYGMGLGPVTFVYIAEVFVTKWRAKGMAWALGISRVLAFLHTMFFPSVVEAIGTQTSFWILALINAIMVVFIWIFAYETKFIEC